MKKLNSNIKLFDNNIPIPVDSYINDHIEKIHQLLFKQSIERYFQETDKSLEDYRIIDIKNENNYLLPSKAIIISKRVFNKEKIDLTPYWNLNYLESPQKDIINQLLIGEENKKDIEVEYIDYIKGKVKFKNKFTNKEFFVDFSKIDNNLQYKKKLNTFTELYRDAIN